MCEKQCTRSGFAFRMTDLGMFDFGLRYREPSSEVSKYNVYHDISESEVHYLIES